MQNGVPPEARPEEMARRSHATIKSILEFDRAEVRPVILGQIGMAQEELCFCGLYIRSMGTAESALKLAEPKDFQASIMLTRSLLELAVDLQLLHRGLVAQAAEKMLAFHDLELLRTATKLVSLADRRPELSLDVEIQRRFVAEQSGRIHALHARLWGTDSNGRRKSIRHWSGWDFSRRVEAVGDPFEAWQAQYYAQFSWHSHGGLAGFVSVPADAFIALQALALHLFAECLHEILKIIIRAFQLAAATDQILEHLHLAYYLPWTDSEEQARQFAADLLRN